MQTLKHFIFNWNIAHEILQLLELSISPALWRHPWSSVYISYIMQILSAYWVRIKMNTCWIVPFLYCQLIKCYNEFYIKQIAAGVFLIKEVSWHVSTCYGLGHKFMGMLCLYVRCVAWCMGKTGNKAFIWFSPRPYWLMQVWTNSL